MSDTKPHIALIGLGLIGSSIGHALKKHNVAAHISGYARTQKSCALALDIGFVDSVHDTAQAAVANADIIFLNVPLGAMREVVTSFLPTLKPGAIISDVGSVKACVWDEIAPLLPEKIHFVPAHPIAGTEFSGPEAGFATLFEGRWCILTPHETTKLIAVDTITKLWQAMGCEVAFMDAAHHDLVLAITSHIPHLIAYNIVGTAADLETEMRSAVIQYSASGFRDFTRIAASDPVMWRDIFLKNKPAILHMLDKFTQDLDMLKSVIEAEDGERLQAMLARTRSTRKNIIAAGQDIAAPNFGRHISDKNS